MTTEELERLRAYDQDESYKLIGERIYQMFMTPAEPPPSEDIADFVDRRAEAISEGLLALPTKETP
jgi:hypothetical protein